MKKERNNGQIEHFIDIEYPYPFERIPKGGITLIYSGSSGETIWKSFFPWNLFWEEISNRVASEYNPRGQSGFDGWGPGLPVVVTDEAQQGDISEIEVRLPFKHKFEDEIEPAEVRIILAVNVNNGVLENWQLG